MDRRRGKAESAWVRQFSCEDVRPLIVCRGPVRKETMDIFEETGITHYGILISEKDSIVYTYALAPELRMLTDHGRIHRVPDYTGANKEERVQRVRQIIAIARENDYNSVFAGYGFMAEDEEFVAALEDAGLNFIGPCAHTVRAAGRKDEAKRTALSVGVSVTPGVDNATTLTLLAKCPDRTSLLDLADAEGLTVSIADDAPLETLAEALLEASYTAGVDIISIEEIAEQVREQVAGMFTDRPDRRVRLKAIGGGGGKGQRILAAPSADESIPLEKRIADAAAAAPGKLREILNEIKAIGVGDNKNILLELNIEQTRHQEIQLIGNGDWCLSMGARDCSAQMYEQKLLEISVTQEGLASAIDDAEKQDRKEAAAALTSDLAVLRRMETEAERFGAAVGLDSASTFECIVDGDKHFFMEVNTRIQVEHRVSELCYSLKFTNPDDDNDFFMVHSLIETMVLLARHGKNLPKPERVVRKKAALESRLNATDIALSPHAGGLITYWSDPLSDEIRDDQGISLKNPDTGRFMKYKIAGAYDSNIALLVTHGESREDGYRRLSEILRRTKLAGKDLATNLSFHYGLVNWFRGQSVYARVTTRFVVPYLTQLGLLREQARDINLDALYRALEKERLAEAGGKVDDPEEADTLEAATQEAMVRKQNLLLRPLQLLLEDPHLLSGWLSMHRRHFEYEDGRVVWTANPVHVLADTYHYLNMDYRAEAPAAEVIWKQDFDLLAAMQRFYSRVQLKGESEDFRRMDRRLSSENPPEDEDPDHWSRIRAAHPGFQAGFEILSLLPLIAGETGFFELRVLDNLEVHLPQKLLDEKLQKKMRKVLVPPPPVKSDEIQAVCGGMFYPREAPGHDPFIVKGGHFEKGDPLYIVEVMKMFNTVYAPFSGTVDEVLIDSDGIIVSKGQTLFRVTPDEEIEVEDATASAERKRETLQRYLASMC
ncbi:MAG: biotin carboxylase N-terminal domain-containing protein [Acidobacteriota bacterium]|nr:biotin carboxylase N-terminal domain-containing protein [Acidobacteriota bacterium]